MITASRWSGGVQSSQAGDGMRQPGQRKILVNYAKRQVGNKIYGGQTSHCPFKLNMAG